MTTVDSPIRTRRMTAIEFGRWSGNKGCELINGEVVERKKNGLVSMLGVKLSSQLLGFVDEHDLGNVFNASLTFDCFANATGDADRRASVAFVAKGRLTEEQWHWDHCPIEPEFVIEIASCNETEDEVSERINDFLNAGTKLVWVVDSKTEFASIHRSDGSKECLADNARLSGESVLRGFECDLSEIFSLKRAVKS